MEFESDILEINNVANNVKCFKLSRPKNFDYKAGQHCVISIIESNNNLVRPFTFSSSPTNKDYLELTIKKNGEFTNELFSKQVGTKLLLRAPLGETYVFDETNKTPLIFLSGGSGITPFLSILNYIKEKKLDNNITLFNGNLTKKDIICKNELDEFNLLNNINIINVISNCKDSDFKNEICNFETGFIMQNMIEKYIDNKNDYKWYICGPPPMVKAMKNILKVMKIKKEMIKVDDW